MAVRVASSMPGDSSCPVEMLYDGSRICASNAEEALGLIVEGYRDIKPGPARMQARLALALRARSMVQMLLNAGELFDESMDEQRRILLARQDAPPPRVEVWDGVVPLVLVTSFYRPLGDRDQPRVAGPGQVWWIDPHTSGSLLRTLHQARWLDVTRMEAGSDDQGSPYRNLGSNGAAGYWWRPCEAGVGA